MLLAPAFGGRESAERNFLVLAHAFVSARSNRSRRPRFDEQPCSANVAELSIS